MARAVRTLGSGAAVVAILLWCSPAPVSACGNDDDDSGSSDSSSDDSGASCDADDGPSGGEAVPACVDRTEITGLERCSSYGAGWDVEGVPPLAFGIGFALRRVSLGSLTLAGETTHEDHNYNYRLVGSELEDPDPLLAGVSLRAVSMLVGGLYVGVEGEAAFGALSGRARDLGSVTVAPRTAGAFGGGLVTGFALRIGGPLVLRAEVLTGGRVIMIDLETRRGSCVETATTTYGRWIVEPRAAIDWNVSPWITFGGWLGSNLLAPGEVGGGATAAFHFRSFDGLGR